MKLEPKHLAPYLPYEMVFVIDMYKFTEGNCKPEIRQFTMGNDLSMCLSYGTPILFPLSSLTKEITVNGETFVPIYKIYEFEQWDTDELEEIINDGTIEGIYNDLSLIPYSHAEKLFEWKIDVFGLIESGLAEPVTEDFNPYK